MILKFALGDDWVQYLKSHYKTGLTSSVREQTRKACLKAVLVSRNFCTKVKEWKACCSLQQGLQVWLKRNAFIVKNCISRERPLNKKIKKVVYAMLEKSLQFSLARPEPIIEQELITIFHSLRPLYFFLTEQLLLNLIRIDGNGA